MLQERLVVDFLDGNKKVDAKNSINTTFKKTKNLQNSCKKYKYNFTDLQKNHLLVIFQKRMY
jgi:hypothetical protein